MSSDCIVFHCLEHTILDGVVKGGYDKPVFTPSFNEYCNILVIYGW